MGSLLFEGLRFSKSVYVVSIRCAFLIWCTGDNIERSIALSTRPSTGACDVIEWSRVSDVVDHVIFAIFDEGGRYGGHWFQINAGHTNGSTCEKWNRDATCNSSLRQLRNCFSELSNSRAISQTTLNPFHRRSR